MICQILIHPGLVTISVHGSGNPEPRSPYEMQDPTAFIVTKPTFNSEGALDERFAPVTITDNYLVFRAVRA